MRLSSLQPLPNPPRSPDRREASVSQTLPVFGQTVGNLIKPTVPFSAARPAIGPLPSAQQAMPDARSISSAPEIPTAPIPSPEWQQSEKSIVTPPKTAPIFSPVPASSPVPNDFKNSQETPPPDFTDDDLLQALAPLIHGAIRSRESNLHLELEPMLRATVRRSLAEFSPTQRPFMPPGIIDRILWRLEALFTSRTYEDILFKKTHRFQVDEVFALDAATLSLISYASCDPARHTSISRITPTVHRLASQLRDANGQFRPLFELPDGRSLLSFRGRWIVLMALVRGKPNELLMMDLNYSLQRIEERFRERFKTEGSPLLQALQPFLEDCLLIQAPTGVA